MRPFTYDRIETIQSLASVIGTDATPIAGGTTLLDLMKLDVERPSHLLDITPLATTPQFGAIEIHDDGVRLGALVSMSAAANHPVLQKSYPVLVQSLDLAASQQLRNMATLGGNVLQRTRCPYFRDTSWQACNKRAPGSGCAALGGFNRMHAVLGTSDACIATYPGDFAQALMALDARVEVVGPAGGRSIPFADLHREPGTTPNIETALAKGDIIVAIDIPPGSWPRSTYVKVRDRQSYEFALTSAAVALALDGDRVSDARIALGGVATRPWRAHQAEALLKDKPLDETAAHSAADIAFADAVSHEHNAFKIPLGKATLVRALLEAKAMEI